MFGSFRVLKPIRTEGDFFTIFDDGLAGDVNKEMAFVGVVNPQLMAAQLKYAVVAVVNKNCGFGNCSSNGAIFKVFEEKYLCFGKDINHHVIATYYLERSIAGAFSGYCYLLA